jgi:hypothetical protein
LVSKPVVKVVSSLTSKPVATVSRGLTSKLVVDGFLVCASKLAAAVY